MSERITTKQLEKQIELLNKGLNRPTTMFENKEDKLVHRVGHLYLHKSHFGYTLEEITSEQGGVSHPLSASSLTAREMYNTLHTLRDVLVFGTLKPFPKA